MSNEGISIDDAVNRWCITRSQAKKLDKIDGDADNGTKGNGRISGTVFEMAEEYYANLQNEGKSYGKKEGTALIKIIKETIETLKERNTNSENTIVDKNNTLVEDEKNNKEANTEKVENKKSLEELKMRDEELSKELQDLKKQATDITNKSPNHPEKLSNTDLEKLFNIHKRIQEIEKEKNEILSLRNKIEAELAQEIVTVYVSKANIAISNFNTEEAKSVLIEINKLIEKKYPPELQEQLQDCKNNLEKFLEIINP